MSVRTAYPSVFAEAAESLGLRGFQRIVEVRISGSNFDHRSLTAIHDLRQLKKLIVVETHVSPCNLARFAERRPEVEIVTGSSTRQTPALLQPAPASLAIGPFSCP